MYTRRNSIHDSEPALLAVSGEPAGVAQEAKPDEMRRRITAKAPKPGAVSGAPTGAAESDAPKRVRTTAATTALPSQAPSAPMPPAGACSAHLIFLKVYH